MKVTKNNRPDQNRSFGQMVAGKVSRRGVLKLTAFAGAGVAAAPLLATAADLESNQVKVANSSFSPIMPVVSDALILPKGYNYTVIRKTGDHVIGGEKFGENSDYTAYFPLDMLSGGASSSDGLLWVNHEYFYPLFITGRADNVNPTFEQLVVEKSVVGGSVIRVRKTAGGGWEFVDDPAYNRRITAWTMIDLDGPAAGSPELFGAREVQGTVGNCGGGITPWGTALSGEENYQSYKPDASTGGYGWGKSDTDNRFFTDEHYGWVVEIDPFNKTRKPVKHTALGRFQHEGATVALGNSGKAVVYTGHDANDECVYKFISKGTFNPNDREANMKLLSEGILYVADYANGKWLPLDINLQPKLKEKYKSQAEVLINTAAAGKLIGGTRTDRPEDIKINPIDKSVFIAFTNNTGHGNFHGHIGRIFEAGADHEALEFTWEVFATGGPQKDSGFSAPDNLLFDKEGNLLILTDMSSNRAGKGIYKFAGNNGVWVVPTSGKEAGVAFHFLSGPMECEVTGGFFTPDFKTMFMSVQHPGENSPSLDKLTSAWPEGGKNIPKSAVVAITGFK